jgi:hypothetical protein
VPILVPRSRAAEIRQDIDGTSGTDFHKPVRSSFEELFVDLGDNDEEAA